ncbi:MULTISPECIES: glycosyltransferase family 4 protein [Gluconobacter]|uniref:Glycosyltransferase family 4 protein n=1 Tax=Gluconobacter cadivus TaxID=2728101 RepID=A0ABR9YTU5_9PROT|nr:MULTISPECIES: glycosyltransferase family 1 protein [Gluconobacter]MBF0887936.1 glycosyltransferase family 4 protein [Gluconobacter cadivus]MBS1058901.1 glycosyltransferase family 4 protein [Gluconobacter sp. Dm-44]
MTLWIDVDDLLFHLVHHGRPSGIQRVVFELCAGLRTLHGHNVQFVRRGANKHDPRDFRTIDWSVVDTLLRQVMKDSGAKAAKASAPLFSAMQFAENETHRQALTGILQTEGQVLGGLASLWVGLGRLAVNEGKAALRRRRQQSSTDAAQHAEGTPLAEAVEAGDVFLTLGSPWHHENYVHTVRWLRDELRVSFGFLMHDLAPIRCPEWCHIGVITTFRAWHHAVLPLADIIFANSRATAQDVQSYLAEEGIGTGITVQHVPMGTEFGLAETVMPTERLVSEPYVLFVSTIEARKNHMLLFRIWRQMLEDMPVDQVPTLVFAGRPGWLVSDLMQQLENTKWLDGKIRFIQNPSDAELRRLYSDCSFSVFPSFFEGWGLPVTEGLAMGRPCIASNTTSIPEAGGPLGRYFNPRNLREAYALIRQVIDDPEDLAAWTQKVRSEFKPVPWTTGAKVILDAVQR